MPRARAVSVRLLAVASAGLIIAGCGGASPSSGGASAGSVEPPSSAPASAPASGGVEVSSSPATSEAPSSSASAGGSTIALTATEFAYAGPTTAPAGVTTIQLQNAGKEEHQAQLVRVNDGSTFDDLAKALATGDPTAALKIVTVAGGPNLVQPGATGSTTQNLAPGTYAFLCFISGADDVPHLAKGMIAQLTVTGTAADAPLPAGDATVTAKDFSFDVAGPVAPGAHTFTLTNDGPQPHEAGLIKLTGDMTVEQIRAIFTAPAGEEPQGPPPWQDQGGIGAIAPGSSATFTATLEPGAKYAFICFVPDPATGKPHAQLGMVTEIPTQ